MGRNFRQWRENFPKGKKGHLHMRNCLKFGWYLEIGVQKNWKRQVPLQQFLFANFMPTGFANNLILSLRDTFSATILELFKTFKILVALVSFWDVSSPCSLIISRSSKNSRSKMLLFQQEPRGRPLGYFSFSWPINGSARFQVAVSDLKVNRLLLRIVSRPEMEMSTSAEASCQDHKKFKPLIEAAAFIFPFDAKIPAA